MLKILKLLPLFLCFISVQNSYGEHKTEKAQKPRELTGHASRAEIFQTLVLFYSRHDTTDVATLDRPLLNWLIQSAIADDQKFCLVAGYAGTREKRHCVLNKDQKGDNDEAPYEKGSKQKTIVCNPEFFGKDITIPNTGQQWTMACANAMIRKIFPDDKTITLDQTLTADQMKILNKYFEDQGTGDFSSFVNSANSVCLSLSKGYATKKDIDDCKKIRSFMIGSTTNSDKNLQGPSGSDERPLKSAGKKLKCYKDLFNQPEEVNYFNTDITMGAKDESVCLDRKSTGLACQCEIQRPQNYNGNEISFVDGTSMRFISPVSTVKDSSKENLDRITSFKIRTWPYIGKVKITSPVDLTVFCTRTPNAEYQLDLDSYNKMKRNDERRADSIVKDLKSALEIPDFEEGFSDACIGTETTETVEKADGAKKAN